MEPGTGYGMLVDPELAYIVSASNEDCAVGHFCFDYEDQHRLVEILDGFNQEITDLENEYNDAYSGIDINTTLKEVEDRIERRSQILASAICAQFNCPNKDDIAQFIRDGTQFQLRWLDMSVYAKVKVPK